MQLLRQRRSQPLLRSDDDEQVSPIRRTPTFSLKSSPNLPAAPGGRTTSLFRRVSYIFGGRGKRNGTSSGIGHVAIGCHRSGYSSPSLPSSEEDIRRPSGLGPRSTSFESLPYPATSEFTLIGDIQERSRCKSSPEVLLSVDKPTKLGGRNRANGHTVPVHKPLSPQIPLEILHVIMSYLPRHDVASLAIVSKSFTVAAQASLYGVIDLRGLQKAGLKQLMVLLASRPQRANAVHTFICHRWPASRSSRIDPRTRLTTPPTSTSKFAIALTNMRNITSLTLPTFEAALLNNTTFKLQSLTLLNQRLSSDEQAELFSWLALQPGITSLRLPKLVDSIGGSDDPLDDDKHGLPYAPPDLSHAVTFPSLSGSTITKSTSFLPSLRALHATPAIAALILPHGSLSHVTVHMNSTLYSGFRPSTLMDVLHGVPEIGLRFGEGVDKRTLEKTVSAAGSVLAEGPSGKCVLRELDIEVGWVGGGTDEVRFYLYYSLAMTQTKVCLGAVQNHTLDPSSIQNLAHSAPASMYTTCIISFIIPLSLIQPAAIAK
jgi:hypothetical protein